MLSGFPSFVLMPISFVLFCINLAVCGTLVFLGGVLKFIVPSKRFHRWLYQPMHTFYRRWISTNMDILKAVNNVEIEISGAENLKKDGWYLLLANHQSWLDIFVIAGFAHNRIPEPKFFLKDSLKRVPFLGMACWALDMPFMKRYSKAFIEKHPHLKGQDIETTKKSCQSFKTNPTTIINFVEGTRFTKQKHNHQKSPFRNLLTPKAGGIAFTLAALGDRFDKILNVTVLYPENPGHVMKDMLKGKLTKIRIHVEQLPVTEDLVGDYFHDTEFKAGFQTWLNESWQSKDTLIDKLHEASAREASLKSKMKNPTSAH
ncbi:acyltransferase [Thalassotalea euphylliae]|uniref:acyltransferase n=1 Tax=Thalassotalea euphylliae TaxID=1655234 RepID=UPI003631043E